MHNAISQRGERLSFDMVLIGSGIAGLSCVLEWVKHQPQLRIALICKETLHDSNTRYAQGGIAAAVTPSDLSQHIQDTLQAGDGLCHEAVVNAILNEGAESVDYLLKQGVIFDRDDQGELMRTREAGHSERRIYHVGDHTGAAVVDALIQQLKQCPQVTLFEGHTAINLITQVAVHQPGQYPEVVGVYVLDEKTGLIHTFLANAVVLATGGAGKVYRYTSNANVATGDGIAMAYRAGARVGGLAYYQFHPTLLYHPKINNLLISEALRGEGAYLCCPKTGERFMQHYAKDKMELATRDVVARAIFTEIEKNNHDFVYLDARHLGKAFLQSRFPMIFRSLLEVGLDMSEQCIPVVPAAHYLCGGVLSRVDGTTDLNRLYAIGETAFTGLHGANRLASNSLLEGVVMGRRAATASLSSVQNPVVLSRPVSDWNSTGVVDSRRASQIAVHWRGLRGEMSAYAGIVRTEAGLRDQLNLIAVRRKMIDDYYWKHTITRDLLELRNIILVAELIVRSALNQRESRGGHYREDVQGGALHRETDEFKLNWERVV